MVHWVMTEAEEYETEQKTELILTMMGQSISNSD